ncbi:MAG: beta-CASP ribonuclease aCPSF1 [Candidatus Njordarchaeia archaeon]
MPNDVQNLGISGWMDRLFKLILSELPKDAKITSIKFEGPRMVLYSKNPELLVLKQALIKTIAKKYHKRISIRSDESIRLDKKEAEKRIKEIVSERAGISNIYFDDITGQVYIEAEKPGVVIGPKGETRRKITMETLWFPVIIRKPPIASNIMAYVRKINEIKSDERLNFLREIGERIHRPYVFKKNNVRISILGGARVVGGNAFLIQTKESNVLIDAGIRVGAGSPEDLFPKFNLPEFSIDELDAVIVTHAHIDHSGMVPFLYKYGYRGPVYCTEPTKYLMVLLQRDYIDVARKEARLAPYSHTDIDREILHTITFNYEEVNDITPDIRLTLYNAGHILGSAIVHIHVAEGLYNLVFASDIKYSDTRMLDKAETNFPRVETLFIESTYGGPKDTFPPQEVAERQLIDVIKKTLERGGKVLIPVLAVGRAQEILLVLYHYIRERKILPEIPVYLSGMIREAVAIHAASPEFLSRRLRDKILHKNRNPFLADFFIDVKNHDEIYQISEGSEKAVILATNGMLNGGPVMEFFKLMAKDPKNSLVFVAYQAPGTLGWNILRGARELNVYDREGERTIKINMEVIRIRGFSGHSPFPELVRFIKTIKPPPSHVVVVHGEEKKCSYLANYCRTKLNMESTVPKISESIRLL